LQLQESHFYILVTGFSAKLATLFATFIQVNKLLNISWFLNH